MPRKTHARAPARRDAPPDGLARPPTTTARVPRRRTRATLCRCLALVVPSGPHRHRAERPWRRPDPTRWDTLTERLARQHPQLYIDVLQR
jgi:hypothetical protein